MKILIVDDSRAMQAIVRTALLQAGLGELEIVAAESGHAAHEILQRSPPPDLILTDWHMPGMTGLELLQLVRQMELAEVELGFITTETQPDRLAQAHRNGAAFVLNKPFRDEALIDEVRDVIQRRPSRVRPLVAEISAMDALLRGHLKAVPFRLAESAMDTSHLTALNQLALFKASDSDGVVALGVMDGRCAAMLALGVQGIPPSEARSRIESGRLERETSTALAGVWTDAAAVIRRGPQPAVQFHQQSTVAREYPKLSALFRVHKGMTAFRLDIPGYGSGRLAFFLI